MFLRTYSELGSRGELKGNGKPLVQKVGCTHDIVEFSATGTNTDPAESASLPHTLSHGDISVELHASR